MVVPWNIIKYNIFGGVERGPDLYGTEPWSFYLLNLVLNFNVLAPLALISLPALYITFIVDRERLGSVTKTTGLEQTSSPLVVLGFKLLPVYVWIGILTSQAHKEERFMFPAYPMLCFNAAVALYLIRGWMEVVFIHFTKSPYNVNTFFSLTLLCTKLIMEQASRSTIFSSFTTSVVCGSALISISRILALWNYYHAPQTVYYLLESEQLPRLLNSTGLLPIPLPNTNPEDLPNIDLSPVKHFNLTLCLGKEWYRFPGHYLVPDGVRVDFIKSAFDGALPGHFVESPANGDGFWWRQGTRRAPEGLNDLNREVPAFYVSFILFYLNKI